MTHEELEHAIRAACDVAEDDEIWVFGSQSLLGQYEDPPEELRMSAEVDVAPVNAVERTVDIDANLGELSQAQGPGFRSCSAGGGPGVAEKAATADQSADVSDTSARESP